MKKKKIRIGQKVICVDSGVVGIVIGFKNNKYKVPLTCVVAEDGLRHSAPTSLWAPYKTGLDVEAVYCYEDCIATKEMHNKMHSSPISNNMCFNPSGTIDQRVARSTSLGGNKIMAKPSTHGDITVNINLDGESKEIQTEVLVKAIQKTLSDNMRKGF